MAEPNRDRHKRRFCDCYPCFGFPQGGVPRRGKLAPVETGVFFRLECFEMAFGLSISDIFTKKRLHISSIQDTMIEVRANLFW